MARQRKASAGFTLVEVMIAILLAMIGLMGTLAIQQTVLSSTQNANDGQIAMRLASQSIEEFNARVTRRGPPVVDMLLPRATGNWSAIEYLDVNGRVGAQSPTNRWARQWRVLNTGAGLPYDISVTITYNLDSGMPKVVRLDVERRKEW
ncbi:MAG: prepilin-type N-terminal cleavage/methylation domain-containing protein [Deltaproteobacteria bacterium]|nr:prepilin-type N-terminal cleavage/methylation domain-containing protein [Deltaproteobacteria bacterium]